MRISLEFAYVVSIIAVVEMVKIELCKLKCEIMFLPKIYDIVISEKQSLQNTIILRRCLSNICRIMLESILDDTVRSTLLTTQTVRLSLVVKCHCRRDA